MPPQDTNQPDAQALALNALVWTISDPRRAERLLDLTGLEPGELRDRAGDPALLTAVLGFLESYEPDLIACAEALEVDPTAFPAARRALEHS